MAAAKQKTEKSADAFRSIGEAAAELDLQTHVLRYWEGKFPGQIKPIKRRDGRRFFRPEDMDALRAVQVLVHQRGLTLKGARNLLDEQGVDAVLDGKARLTAVTDEEIAGAPSPARDLQMTVRDAFVPEADPEPADAIPTGETGSVERLETVLAEMTDIKARLDAALTRQAA